MRLSGLSGDSRWFFTAGCSVLLQEMVGFGWGERGMVAEGGFETQRERESSFWRGPAWEPAFPVRAVGENGGRCPEPQVVGTE